MIQSKIEESRAWMKALFSNLRKLAPAEKNERVAIIRSIAVRAREDTAARSYVEWLVKQIERDMPTETRTFWACYLDGQTARSVGRAHHMDKRSVHRCNRRALEAMLPLVFGLGGIYTEAP